MKKYIQEFISVFSVSLRTQTDSARVSKVFANTNVNWLSLVTNSNEL